MIRARQTMGVVLTDYGSAGGNPLHEGSRQHQSQVDVSSIHIRNYTDIKLTDEGHDAAARPLVQRTKGCGTSVGRKPKHHGKLERT